MLRTYKWVAIAAFSLTIFGLCVWLCNALLPWDTATRVGVGTSAGAVIAAVVTTAFGSVTAGGPVREKSGSYRLETMV
jgi:hypothetical protein